MNKSYVEYDSYIDTEERHGAGELS